MSTPARKIVEPLRSARALVTTWRLGIGAEDVVRGPPVCELVMEGERQRAVEHFVEVETEAEERDQPDPLPSWCRP
jgi:hypothetical protein